jgi:hypothetical protein
MRWLFALLVACNVGCAGDVGRTIEWTKSGATQAAFDRDNGICTKQAQDASRRLIGGRDARHAHNRVLISCMRNLGWERTADREGS